MAYRKIQHATEYVIDQDTFTWLDGAEDTAPAIDVTDYYRYVMVNGDIHSYQQIEDLRDVLNDILEDRWLEERWKGESNGGSNLRCARRAIGRCS